LTRLGSNPGIATVLSAQNSAVAANGLPPTQTASRDSVRRAILSLLFAALVIGAVVLQLGLLLQTASRLRGGWRHRVCGKRLADATRGRFARSSPICSAASLQADRYVEIGALDKRAQDCRCGAAPLGCTCVNSCAVNHSSTRDSKKAHILHGREAGSVLGRRPALGRATRSDDVDRSNSGLNLQRSRHVSARYSMCQQVPSSEAVPRRWASAGLAARSSGHPEAAMRCASAQMS
jgi:hypothetical protein